MALSLLGAPTTRDHIANALEANLRKGFIDKVAKWPAVYSGLYNVMDSDKKIERFAVYAGYGTFPSKNEGGVITYDSMQEAWTKAFTHSGYALGVQCTIEAMQDDLHGIIRSFIGRGAELAEVANYTKEVNAMDLWNTYLTSGTVYTAGGTNYPLASTTHALVTGGTWSNRPASAMDLSMEALEFAVNHWMQNQVNQRNQKTMIMPQDLIVGTADWALALRLQRSEKRATSADNDENVITDYIKNVKVLPLLTNDGRWGLHGPKEETGLIYFDRYKPNIHHLPDGDNGNLRMYCFYREAHGAVHARHLWWTP